MELSAKILSDIVVHMKYARYREELGRRETWEEITTRNKNMHIKKFPFLASEIEEVYKLVYERKVLPSLRSAQFAGKPIEINPSRIYNCSFCPVDHWKVFSEIMFLLLGGTGCGYSVQRHHVDKLPEIKARLGRNRRYLIGDSIEGWADAVKMLVSSYFHGTSKIVFDFSDIRPKGERLVTSGGKAPGPQPLKDCIHNLDKILSHKEPGDKLTPLECHDMICYIADAVLAGGIRRAALISLFSFDDDDMIACKYGNWWESNPQRGRANNSAVILRHKIDKETFMSFWKKIEASRTGEPGIFLTFDKEVGTNPSLRAGTRVCTSTGVFPIEELEDKTFYVPNLDGKMSEASCWKSGKDKPLWEMTLDTGAKYYCTAEHQWPIYVNGRYVKCRTDELKVNDLLPINNFNREKLFEGDGKGTYKQGVLLGWLYGDGCLTERSDTGKYVASFVVSKKEQKDVLPLLVEEIKKIDNVERKTYERGEVSEFQVGSSDFISWAMDTMSAHKKENGLPKQIWTEWSEECRRGFINGLFSADGHVPTDSHGITLKSSRKKLIEDVQDLLGFYGIKSSLRKVVVRGVFGSDKEYTNYTLRTYLSGRHQFNKLFHLCVSEKQERLIVGGGNEISSVNQRHVILRDIKLTNMKEDVWDITVRDDTHCFHIPQVTTGNCAEISLKANSFCNLTTINASDVEDQAELNKRVRAAAFIGTLQASYTDFHYLRDCWRRTTEKDSLLGVSMTGIASNKVFECDLKEASQIVLEENERLSEMLGINKAARTTCVKPEGSSSLVVGTSSGIHAWYAPYYIRRIRVGKNEAIYQYLKNKMPSLVEDDFFKKQDAVISIPVKSPDGAIHSSEKALNILERVKRVSVEWVHPGHRRGDNKHNVSATIATGDDEWDEVGKWMWENRKYYAGLTVLPRDGGTYKQTPFEEISKEEYDRLFKELAQIDLSEVGELEDNTDLQGEIACGGGSCEIK
jgi:hypothetical protein